MEKNVQLLSIACVLLIVVITQINAVPLYAPDYDQGGNVREMLAELERQGLTGMMERRAYYPDHRMMRKSQRSNLRLRFGKRSPEDEASSPLSWKTVEEFRSRTQ